MICLFHVFLPLCIYKQIDKTSFFRPNPNPETAYELSSNDQAGADVKPRMKVNI